MSNTESAESRPSSVASAPPSPGNVVSIAKLADHVGETVTVRGWLYNKRSSGKLHFLEVRDGSGIVQAVVFKGNVSPELFAAADRIQQESSIEVDGLVKEHGKLKGTYELDAKDVRLVAATAREYPISPKEHGTDFLMDHRHLWLRSKRQHAIMRVRHAIIKAVRDFFDENDFTLVDAPVFTPNACEGTSTLFQTDYHGEPAYLTQSGQLYMEAGAAAFGKVYCFGPTFRAEKSKTRRHLAEFWMVEPEVAFMDLAGDMVLAEQFLSFVVARVLETRKKELDILASEKRPDDPEWWTRHMTMLENIKAPFPRITYHEAIDLLQKNGHPDAKVGDDFGGDEETTISKKFDRPVIIHRYPMDLKAFYFARDPNDPTLALNMDVLAPEGYGEIIGGGQREADLARLESAIAEHRLPKEAFEWYLDLRRYGSFPHAGFGLGIERTVSWICGLPHVRETIPFPRMLNRLAP
ncbi:MAG: asparagine--tRNA ligase [Labilithrix sp.]|nr:asparagine--tRNA ligase [Labilithrix sp.]MBX3222003.1 asparagine--tRNA ligase [Labilithrix sp.]